MKNRLTTQWLNVKGISHRFASKSPGIISICGQQRVPEKPTPESTVFCWCCGYQLRLILNPEKFAPPWRTSTRQ